MVKLAVWACAVGAVLGASAVSATDRSVRCGTQAVRSGPDTTISSSNHVRDAQSAVIVEGGRTTLLPGASINTIGVLNEINVVGDNNIIDADQTGTNTGDVTSSVTISE